MSAQMPRHAFRWDLLLVVALTCAFVLGFSLTHASQTGSIKGVRPAGKDSLGLTPLTDLAGEAHYKGQNGGLYGGGKNQPPDQHLQAALQIANQIQPLDAEGKPSSNGKIVLISVGMSNTTQEFRTFMTLANRDEQKSAFVALVDGAQGGMEASAWANPERARQMRRPDPWSVLEQRLKEAGFSAGQVQVAFRFFKSDSTAKPWFLKRTP